MKPDKLRFYPRNKMIGLIGSFFPLLSFPLIDKISAFYFELLLIHFRKVWDIKLSVWNIETHYEGSLHK